MITYKNFGSHVLFYDDTIDLSVQVLLPRRSWNQARTEYRDRRASVSFQSRTFTGPETERLAELLRQAGSYANEMNAIFDREMAARTASDFNEVERA